MERKREILCAWLGNSDVKEAGKGEEGPILAAMRRKTYDQLMLLSSQTEEDTNRFTEWLRNKTTSQIKSCQIRLDDPTDFAGIYKAAKDELNNARKAAGKEVAFTYHISPGTQAMGAAWIILNMTHFPGILIQAHRESGVKEVDKKHWQDTEIKELTVPFEVQSDFIPQLLKTTKASLTRSLTEKPSHEKFGKFDWQNKSMLDLIDKARLFAPYDEIPILILGPNGTGKEELAKFIHKMSSRGGKEPEVLNCGAISANLIEAELFGTVKGGFSDSIDKPGYLELANGGTLFLDEIGDMPLDAQVKLLRAVQQKKFKRVGGTKEVTSNFRLICATNRNLMKAVAAEKFREDLFYRIAGCVIQIPPLAERREDLIKFAEHLLDEINKELIDQPKYTPKIMSESARAALLDHSWPGNVREMNNTLKQAAVCGKERILSGSDISAAIIRIGAPTIDILSRPLGGNFNLENLRDEVEESYVRRAMKEANNVLSHAGELLGASPQTFTNWVKKFGMYQPKTKKR